MSASMKPMCVCCVCVIYLAYVFEHFDGSFRVQVGPLLELVDEEGAAAGVGEHTQLQLAVVGNNQTVACMKWGEGNGTHGWMDGCVVQVCGSQACRPSGALNARRTPNMSLFLEGWFCRLGRRDTSRPERHRGDRARAM